MDIAGLQKLSLSDFPAVVAAVVFTQGCNFRCPFCHNGALIPTSSRQLMPDEALWSFLTTHRGRLEGVVVSGGEPTLQPDLVAFCRKLKTLGYAVKLDTNGSRPDVLRCLLQERLVDYIAMDIKAPWGGYDRLAGVAAPIARLQQSVRLIANADIAYLFRTTYVERLLTPEDIRAIRQALPPGAPHRLQPFRPDNALDSALRTND